MNRENTFGRKLQQIRKSKGLTQEKLAELAGVHEKHISKLELGTYKPSFNTLSKVLSALDLNIEEVGLNLEKVSANDNPFYIKSMQILSNATEQELEFYYGLLKQGQKGAEIFNSKG
ncbi:MAG: helix-turn-helix domain-containing protein [Candidatus Gastranaerophilales bacterium]|nr:helix-turn-helix domain-containing protein [Candidatus Gastranaerophilales bacterium]